MSFQVHTQDTFAAVGLRAYIAFERFLNHMGLDMGIQVDPLPKTFLALITFERFLSSMGSFMPHKIPSRPKTARTFIAVV